MGSRLPIAVSSWPESRSSRALRDQRSRGTTPTLAIASRGSEVLASRANSTQPTSDHERRRLRHPRRRGRRRAAGAIRRLALFHRPHPHALETARGLPEERRANPTPSAPSRSIRAGRRRSRASRPAPTWWCSIGWTGRAATSCCRCRVTTASERGTFALRSPVRPNPIAMSVVRLVRVDGTNAVGGRPRLPRRHAAARPQALFRLDRCGPGRGGRLAQGAQRT